MGSPAPTAATREQILDAALQELAAAGRERARMEVIAERAGVSRGTLYYHFHGRDELVAALLEQSLDPLAAEVTAAAGSGDPLAVLEAVVAFYAANEARSRFLFTQLPTVPDRVSELMHREKDQVVAPLAACLAARDHPEPEITAEALLGQIHGLAFGRLVRDEPLDLDRAGPHLLSFARRILAR